MVKHKGGTSPLGVKPWGLRSGLMLSMDGEEPAFGISLNFLVAG